VSQPSIYSSLNVPARQSATWVFEILNSECRCGLSWPRRARPIYFKALPLWLSWFCRHSLQTIQPMHRSSSHIQCMLVCTQTHDITSLCNSSAVQYNILSVSGYVVKMNVIISWVLLLVASALLPSQYGTHSHLAFALVRHHILSVVFLKPTVLSRHLAAYTSASDSAFGWHCAL